MKDLIAQLFGIANEHVLTEGELVPSQTELGAHSQMSWVMEDNTLRFWWGNTTQFEWTSTQSLIQATFDPRDGIRIGEYLISMDRILDEAVVVNSRRF